MNFTDNEKKTIEHNCLIRYCPVCNHNSLTYCSEPFVIYSESKEKCRYTLLVECNKCGYSNFINLSALLGQSWVDNKIKSNNDNSSKKAWT